MSGAPQSLYGLNVALRKFKARFGHDQTRMPFSKRDIRFSTRYLPVSVPFHSTYLDSVPAAIEADIVRLGLVFRPKDLRITVLATDDGRDMKETSTDLTPLALTINIVEQITSRTVLWEKGNKKYCEAFLKPHT